ncbi:MAG: hypothetical protein U0531_21215 [Dehalococcoidia bacterium]
MPIRFPTTDRFGAAVMCTTQAWTTHQTKHHKLAGHVGWVIATVQNLAREHLDTQQTNRRCLYRRFVLPGLGQLWREVVLECRRGRSYMASAHATRALKHDEVTLWVNPHP